MSDKYRLISFKGEIPIFIVNASGFTIPFGITKQISYSMRSLPGIDIWGISFIAVGFGINDTRKNSI